MALRTRLTGDKTCNKSYVSEWKIPLDGKRITKAVYLGSTTAITEEAANRLDAGITSIRVTRELGEPFSGDQLKFIASLPDRIHKKLESYGLVRKRGVRRSEDSFALSSVRHEFQQGRDVKESTEDNENRAFDLLEKHFTAEKDVRDITVLAAERFAAWLPKQRLIGNGKLNSSTVSGHLRKITSLFNYMVKAELITKNPFADIRTPMKRDKSNDYYVSIEETNAYIDAVTHPQWKAIIAIARYCGVRGPSDLLYMQRKHVDFKKKQVTFPSIKNGNRVCPLFPEVVEHFKFLCDRESDPNGFLFKDITEGGHGKKGNWDAVRASGKLKDLNLRKTPNSAYRRATGENPIPKFFKNCRATRVTELIKMDGFSQHSVCEWIGHTEAISNEHYLMMMDEDHKRATESKGTPKSTPKTSSTERSPVVPESLMQQVFASLPDEQLDDISLILQGLVSVLESQPESASVLLTAISEQAKKPKSSSNRGRTTGVSHGKYRVGKVWGAKSTPKGTPTRSSKVALAFRKRNIAGQLEAIRDAIDVFCEEFE